MSDKAEQAIPFAGVVPTAPPLHVQHPQRPDVPSVAPPPVVPHINLIAAIVPHKPNALPRRPPPVFRPKQASGIDIVIILLTIPFIMVLVCVAHSVADGADAATISEMVTTSRDMEIVFGIAMGASALSISIGMWLLKWRIVGTIDPDAYDFMPSVFLLLTLLMMFGCGALARYTLKADAGSHMLYASMAFISQLFMLVMLVVSAYTVCRLKNAERKITRWVHLALFFTALAFVMLILFGAGVGSKPYFFEFALLASMYLGSCCLAREKWLDMHERSGTLAGPCRATVVLAQRPGTRFDAL
tara:strand:+ start:64 stop:966 length:903 start_codon:yes stop_codon:yes gene_type:complete